MKTLLAEYSATLLLKIWRKNRFSLRQIYDFFSKKSTFANLVNIGPHLVKIWKNGGFLVTAHFCEKIYGVFGWDCDKILGLWVRMMLKIRVFTLCVTSGMGVPTPVLRHCVTHLYRFTQRSYKPGFTNALKTKCCGIKWMTNEAKRSVSVVWFCGA